MSLVLRPYRLEDEPAARAAQAELAAEHFSFLLGGFTETTEWAAYLDQLADWAEGLNLPEDHVPGLSLAAVVDDELVGRASIRLALNAWLLERGGHIGYAVRPGFRGRGYAHQILAGSLEIIRARGVEKVLVTCNDDNLASAAVIERAGGVLENIAEQLDGERVRRYWID